MKSNSYIPVLTYYIPLCVIPVPPCCRTAALLDCNLILKHDHLIGGANSINNLL